MVLSRSSAAKANLGTGIRGTAIFLGHGLGRGNL